MKKQSFHDILIEKMGPPPAPAVNEPTPAYEIFDNMTPLFHIHVQPSQRLATKAYPVSKIKKTPAPTPIVTPPVPQEFALLKSTLSEDEISVWNLFEKTIGKNFETQITRSQVKSAFRTFAKRHHPDVASASSDVNFAFVVKTKNEMLKLLDKNKDS